MNDLLKSIIAGGAGILASGAASRDRAEQPQATGPAVNLEKPQEPDGRTPEPDMGARIPQNASKTPLWRTVLIFTLCCSLLWECVARPVLASFWPHLELAPSLLSETVTLLMGVAGF